MSTATCLKRAIHREEGFPSGSLAPLFLICGCGRKTPVDRDEFIKSEGAGAINRAVVTCLCGLRYNGAGWLIGEK